MVKVLVLILKLLFHGKGKGTEEIERRDRVASI